MKKRALPSVSLMVPLLLWVAAAAPLHAGDRLYVVPKAPVWLRSGGGVEFKIIDRLKAGEQVEVTEEEGGWAHVVTAKGRDGWVLKRYLSPDPPPEVELARLRSRCGSLEEELKRLQQEHGDTISSLEGCQGRLEQCTQARDRCSQELAALKQDSADIEKTKELLASATKEVEGLKRELVTLKKENAALKSGERLKWFLAGGGVLLVGWLIGLASGRSRRKRSTLL